MGIFSRRPKNGYNSYDDDLYDSSFDRGDYSEGDGNVINGYEDDEPVVAAARQPEQAVPAAPASAPAVAAEPAAAGPVATGAGFGLFKPRGYEDGPEIVRYMRTTGCGAVLDIEEVEGTEAQHLIIFMLGALEALGGELKRVNKTTFILSPCKGFLHDGGQG